jgi:hypothetical protein
MCQFAKLYPLAIVKQLTEPYQALEKPTLENVLSVTTVLNKYKFGQEAPAQIEVASKALAIITQHPIAQIENGFISAPVSEINWSSHMILMDSKQLLVKRLKAIYFSGR